MPTLPRTCRVPPPARVCLSVPSSHFASEPRTHRESKYLVLVFQEHRDCSSPPALGRFFFLRFSPCLRASVVNRSYLSFNVDSANSANTSDAIQKRTMIFDSDHPINSK